MFLPRLIIDTCYRNAAKARSALDDIPVPDVNADVSAEPEKLSGLDGFHVFRDTVTCGYHLLRRVIWISGFVHGSAVVLVLLKVKSPKNTFDQSTTVKVPALAVPVSPVLTTIIRRRTRRYLRQLVQQFLPAHYLRFRHCLPPLREAAPRAPSHILQNCSATARRIRS